MAAEREERGGREEKEIGIRGPFDF
jgi:hypothetical protein